MSDVITADCSENLAKHRNAPRDQNSVLCYNTQNKQLRFPHNTPLNISDRQGRCFSIRQYHIAKFRNREQSDVIPQALASQVLELMISYCTVSNRCLRDT